MSHLKGDFYKSLSRITVEPGSLGQFWKKIQLNQAKTNK